MNTDNLRVFCGTANPELGRKVAKQLGVNCGKISISKFADGEIGLQVNESVRGCDVFLIQPITNPVNDHLMELLLMIDTMRRASAKRITAVAAYYAYARQDRKTRPRVPISAALVAELLESAGADRVIAVDLHCGQIQGFFRIPVDNLSARRIFVEAMRGVQNLNNVCICSPDAGGVERAEKFRKEFKAYLHKDASFAMTSKQRKEAGEIAKMELVGSVKDCDVIIVDDMIDTGGTLAKCAQMLKDNGANRVFAVATHGLFSGEGPVIIEDSPLEKVFVTDIIPLSEEAKKCSKIVQVSCAKLLAECIGLVHEDKSVSSLFEYTVEEKKEDDKNI